MFGMEREDAGRVSRRICTLVQEGRMSSNGHQANTVDSTPPAGRVSEQVAGEFHGLGDEFARLGETLRQHADQVAVLVNRASAAEERCLALDQRRPRESMIGAAVRGRRMC